MSMCASWAHSGREMHLQKPCRLSDTNWSYGGLAGLAINYSSIISPKTCGDAQSASVTVLVSDGEVGGLRREQGDPYTLPAVSEI